VSGLVKGAAKGYFLEILGALKGCGYQVQAKLLDAQWLGVPQVRQRLIFQGVRADLGLDPAFPKPLPYRYTVADALPWIKAVRWDGKGSFKPLVRSGQDPAMTITVNNDHQIEVEAEADISRFAIGQEWDRLKPGEKSERYLNLIKLE